MRVILAFVRAYPGQSLLVLLALVVAGFVEGASLTALLPLLQIAASPDGGAVPDQGPARVVVDVLGQLGLPPSIGVLLLVIAGGMVLRSALVLAAKRRVGYTVAQVATDLRLALLRALLATRWEYFIRRPIGDLAAAMSYQADRASKAYLNGATLVSTVVQLAAYVAVAASVSWGVTVVSLGCAGVVAWLLRSLVRTSRKAGNQQTSLQSSLLRDLTDALQSVKPMKAMAREDGADAVLAAQTRELNDALRSEVLSKEGLKAAQYPAFGLLVTAGAWIGLSVWKLPFTDVLVLLVLIARVLTNLGKVQSQYQDVASCEAAYWSVCDTIAEAESKREVVSGAAAPALREAIELVGVHVGYGGEPVLRGANLEVPAGQLTVLVGESGAGKTTVVDLVTGLLRPDAGDVCIDGTPLATLDLRAWRRRVGYVPQENTLLHDTIRANVTLGDPALDDASVERALRAAGAWDFVSALPAGIGESVGERGSRLSGGQRQRVLIARALALEPALLILDEPTSALDPANEAALCVTLRALRGQVTILAVTHQPALVSIADRVYRLEKGRAIGVELPVGAAAR